MKTSRLLFLDTSVCFTAGEELFGPMRLEQLGTNNLFKGPLQRGPPYIRAPLTGEELVQDANRQLTAATS